VADPGPSDGDFTEAGLEGEGARPSALDALAAFAVPLLEDQLSVGLLDEDLEEPALEFEPGLMDERLDLVGEMLVLVGHGHGHLQLEFE
jgi:hypothetical protein